MDGRAVRIALVCGAFLAAASVAASAQADSANDSAWLKRFQLHPKIIGGEPAKPNEFPFQVALINPAARPGEESGSQFCGGTLIRAKWVLTAAHCSKLKWFGRIIEKGPDDILVFAGATALPQGGAARPAQRTHRVKVIGIYRHESYNLDNHDSDIGLLQLQSPLPEDLIQVEPATSAQEDSLGRTGRTVTVIGWGLTSEGGNLSRDLLKVDVEVQDSGLCEDNYEAFYGNLPNTGKPVVTVNMFCAGKPRGKIDSCNGDSGGFIGAPREGGGWVQLGIVSWGEGCARPGLFGVYTRVSRFNKWINETIAAYSQ